MKPWHAIVLVVAILAFGCCGGVFFLGKKAVTGYEQTDTEATQYADKALPPILQNWDYKLVEKQATPEFLRDQPDAIVATYFDLYKKNLGKFQSITPSRMVRVNAYSGTNGAMTRALVQANASFYRDNGVVTLDMIKRDGKWAINGFYIKSKILEEAIKNKKP
jgi:uncharacterized protein YneF (UPF0154 family)